MRGEAFRCPTCGNPVREGSRFFPFCSHRCRLVDLGQWLDERYRISRPLDPRREEDGLSGGEAAEDISSEEDSEP